MKLTGGEKLPRSEMTHRDMTLRPSYKNETLIITSQ